MAMPSGEGGNHAISEGWPVYTISRDMTPLCAEALHDAAMVGALASAEGLAQKSRRS